MSKNETFNWFELPNELTTSPYPVVSCFGLNIEHNQVHQTVWNCFTDLSRSERLPIRYELIPELKEKIRDKQPIPLTSNSQTGILKKNWLRKYAQSKITVLVLFYQLDWIDVQSTPKRSQCVSFLNSQKDLVRDEHTKLVVVLIQNTPASLSSFENELASDCATKLCNECNLNLKQLNVLHLGDHLHGYVVRLENLFYDLCLEYFAEKINKCVKTIDLLKKSTQQHLIARYAFKIGYFYEMSQESHNALKYYNLSYNNLLNINYNMYSAFEIKMVASFLFYKLAKLMIESDLHKNAIHLFETFIEHFQTKSFLEFEDFAWKSMQYRYFGELLEKSIKNGFKTSQTQHPGCYYYGAAQCEKARRDAFEILDVQDTVYNEEHVSKFNNAIYYGQRPWSVLNESEIANTLKWNEKNFKHPVEIIRLFSKAVEQFKLFNCNRMKRNVIIEMADEYFRISDFGQSLTLILHTIPDYEAENWWNLTSDLVSRALYCAFFTASVVDFIRLCLKALNTKAQFPVSTKDCIYKSFNAVSVKKMPSPFFQLIEPSEEFKAEITENWKKRLASFEIIELDLENQHFCLDCKVQFSKPIFEFNENITLNLNIRNCYSASLFLKSIVLTIKMGQEHKTNQLNQSNVELKPSLINNIDMNIPIEKKNSYTPLTIQIIAIDLIFKTSSEMQIRLRQRNFQNIANKHDRFLSDKFDILDNLLTTSVQPVKSTNIKINVIHKRPILIGEWYKIQIDLKNLNSFKMSHLIVTFNCCDSNENKILLSTDQKTVLESQTYEDKFKELKVNHVKSYEVFVKAEQTGQITVNLTVMYRQMVKDSDVAFTNNFCDTIPAVKPFELETSFTNPLFRTLNCLYANELFFLHVAITSLSEHNILIRKVCTKIKPSLKLESEAEVVYEKELQLQNSESITNCVSLKVSKPSDHSYQICDYEIVWRRCDSSDRDWIVTRTTLDGLAVNNVPIFIDFKIPYYGIVRKSYPVVYNIHNLSDELLELKIEVVQNDNFLLSGYKQLKISVLPSSQKSLTFNVCFLKSGKNELPKLKLLNLDDCVLPLTLTAMNIEKAFERMLPSTIYITSN